MFKNSRVYSAVLVLSVVSSAALFAGCATGYRNTTTEHTTATAPSPATGTTTVVSADGGTVQTVSTSQPATATEVHSTETTTTEVHQRRGLLGGVIGGILAMPFRLVATILETLL